MVNLICKFDMKNNSGHMTHVLEVSISFLCLLAELSETSADSDWIQQICREKKVGC